MQNDQLYMYMSKQEHCDALTLAGFNTISLAMEINGLCLFECQI